MNIYMIGILFIVVLVIVIGAIIVKKKNKNTKKFPSLLLILGITLFCYSMTNLSETKRMLDILYYSTPNYILHYIRLRPIDFLCYPGALIFSMFFLCIAHRRIMKWARSTQTDTEAFDRNESYDKEESKSAQHTDDSDSFKTLVCPNCGMMLPAGESFCQYCGVKIENIGSLGQSPFSKTSKNNIGIKE